MASLFMFDNTSNIIGAFAIYGTWNGWEANYLTLTLSLSDEFSPVGHMPVTLFVNIVLALKQSRN